MANNNVVVLQCEDLKQFIVSSGVIGREETPIVAELAVSGFTFWLQSAQYDCRSVRTLTRC